MEQLINIFIINNITEISEINFPAKEPFNIDVIVMEVEWTSLSVKLSSVEMRDFLNSINKTLRNK